MIKLTQAVIVEGKYDKAKLSSLVDAVIVTTDGFDVFRDRDKLQFIRSLAEKKGIIILTDSDAAGFRIRSYIAGAIPAERITHVYIPDVIGKERRKAAPSAEGMLGVEGVPTKLLLEAFARAGITPLAEDGTAAGVCETERKQTSQDTGNERGIADMSGTGYDQSASDGKSACGVQGTANEQSAGDGKSAGGVQGTANEQSASDGKSAGGVQGTGDRHGMSDAGAGAPIDKSDLMEWGISGGQNSAERRRRLLRTLGMPARMNSNALLKVLNSLYSRDDILRIVKKL